MTFNSDIQKTEKEIAVLQAKLELLKEIETHNNQKIKEAFKVAYGRYPFSTGDGFELKDVVPWEAFQKGYMAALPKAVPPDEPECDETHKSQPRMNFELGGKFEIVSYNDKDYCRYEFDDGSHKWYKRVYPDNGVLMVRISDGETERLLEGLWFNDVKGGKYDEVECDEKDNSKFMVMDEVVEWNEDANTPNLQKIMDKMIKKHQAQKLYNMLKVQLDFGDDSCMDHIVDIVEEWLPKEQSAAGSQNVDTELLVDGFNDCVRKMKEMLR